MRWLHFLFVFVSSLFPLCHLTVSYCVTGYWGGVSPSVLLLNPWFPVKYNESYIRLFWVRWYAICSQTWKTWITESQKPTAPSVFNRIHVHTHTEGEKEREFQSSVGSYNHLKFYMKPLKSFLFLFFYLHTHIKWGEFEQMPLLFWADVRLKWLEMVV